VITVVQGALLIEPASTPTIAAVIVTRDRPQLLSERALLSVTAQTRSPELLVIVDDSSSDVRMTNRELVEALCIPRCRVIYLENARTGGASGGWNTALDFLLAEVAADCTFVAILDDDDAWHSTYLERCEAAARVDKLDMVAAGLRRIESTGEHPTIEEAPEVLRAEDCLVGNPGIQGSNLFVRLSVLLAAGGFDEALLSTTDRDLCIRIADLCKVHYGRLAGPLVDHYADSDRQRLSIRGSASKLEGLSAFWRKHAGRMSIEQRCAFSKRAAALFDWSPPPEPTFLSSHHAAPQELRVRRSAVAETLIEGPPHPPLSLYVGIITSDPAMLLPLLCDLGALARSPGVARLVTLVLDNASPAADLEQALREARQRGVELAVISIAQQRRDATAGAFGRALRALPDGRAGIAAARTMLQRYLGALLEGDPGSFGWLLDDDMRVDDRACKYLSWLPAFRAQGVDVLMGVYEGSSPNPPLNGLRGQLVDIFHNLLWLQKLPAEAALPDRSTENAALRSLYPDYYYDLSRKHTAHLEMPHWLEPVGDGETVAEAYTRFCSAAIGILSGAPLTRPLIAAVPSNPLAAAKDSVNRGGCTFVLNPRALTQTPNTITQLQGREARRSDMIWAIVNRYYRRMNMKAVAFPVIHLGRVSGTPSLNVSKVQGEILGSALYAGLTEFLSERPQHTLSFSLEETEEIRRLSDQQLDRRLRGLQQSFYRIAGLRGAIQAVARGGELDELLHYLDEWFIPDVFDQIQTGVRTHSSNETAVFLASLQNVADDYSSLSVNTDFIHDQIKRLLYEPDAV
jgi:GT2 family glycosyltransferase